MMPAGQKSRPNAPLIAMGQPLAGRRVLALGSGVTLLGTIRVLNAAGAEVWVQADLDDLSRRSRLVRSKRTRLAHCHDSGLSTLLSCVPEGTVPIACSDSWARALSSLSQDARARY